MFRSGQENAVTHASSTHRARLWIEFVCLYALLPALVAGFVRPELGDRVLRSVGIGWVSFETGLSSAVFVFSVLLLTFISMFVVLRRDPSFDQTQLWNRDGFGKEIRRILIGFAIAGPTIAIFTWWIARSTELLDQDGFLYLPRERVGLMIAIAVFYPWISAYPQEVTHRAFFFHRYTPILGEGRLAFVLNVFAFSWLHAPMWNAMALVMTVPAGVLFAYTYRPSGSALASGFEHAIYGVWVFFIGLGYFVYAGH